MKKGIMLNSPLCLLSFLDNLRDRLEHIISYSIVEYALKLKNLDEYERGIIIDDELDEIFDDKVDVPKDYDQDNELHSLILITGKRKGITIGTMKSSIANHKKAQKYVSEYEKIYGKDVYLQQNKDVCFDVRDGNFDYNLFALICAVKSAIGKDAKFKRITKVQIRHRMNGFKAQKIMDDDYRLCIEDMTDEIIDINNKKIERLRNKAEILGFFCFSTYRRRQTYYSTRLDREQLIKAVYRSKDYEIKIIIDKQKAKIEAENYHAKILKKKNSLKKALQNV